MYFLSSWPSPLAYSQRMCTGVGGWDTGMNWGKKGWRRQSLQALGDGIREERKTGCTTELGVRLGDSEAVEDMWVCLQATCCSERSSPWVSRGYLLDWTLGQSNNKKMIRRRRTVQSTGYGSSGAGKAATGVLLQS